MEVKRSFRHTMSVLGWVVLSGEAYISGQSLRMASTSTTMVEAHVWSSVSTSLMEALGNPVRCSQNPHTMARVYGSTSLPSRSKYLVRTYSWTAPWAHQLLLDKWMHCSKNHNHRWRLTTAEASEGLQEILSTKLCHNINMYNSGYCASEKAHIHLLSLPKCLMYNTPVKPTSVTTNIGVSAWLYRHLTRGGRFGAW